MAKHHLKFTSCLVITILLTLGLSISLQSLLAAWNPPTNSPPLDNVGPPVYNEHANPETNAAIFKPLGVSGNLTVSGGGIIFGDGSGLTNLDSTELTGTVSNNRLDADLQDLADGSLSGSKVGTGIDASNLTVGTVSNNRLDADLQDLADGTLSASLVQYGSFFITSAGTNNYVWTSDGIGAGNWTDISSLVTGDDLGDHVADQNINLNSHWLSGDGSNEGIYINNAGNVGIGDTSPGAKLDVNGDFIVGGSITLGGKSKSSWITCDWSGWRVTAPGVSCGSGGWCTAYGLGIEMYCSSGIITQARGASVCIACDSCSCFPAGTKVTMADRSKKNIEDVKIGEKVLGTYDIAHTVIDLARPAVNDRSTYLINDQVEFTPEHPFLTKEGWKVVDLDLFHKYQKEHDSYHMTEPGRLKVGDILITENGEEIIKTLEELHTRSSNEIVYDLILDSDDHSYTANGYITHDSY